MAVLCLLTNTPWPWPTPAGAASASGGFPPRSTTEGERSEGLHKRSRGPRRAIFARWGEEARKMRVPLARARDGVPQEGLASLWACVSKAEL